jgi:hypothetical protein
MLKLCTIHLAFHRSCFEAILIENTCRTLGVKPPIIYFQAIVSYNHGKDNLHVDVGDVVTKV